MRAAELRAREDRVRALHKEGLTNRQIADRACGGSVRLANDILKRLGLVPNEAPEGKLREMAAGAPLGESFVQVASRTRR